jgi:DNA-binding HxlR family transcriptional regulator
MPSKDELIIAELHDGPKRQADLERILVKSGKMSKTTLIRHLRNLEKNKAVARIVDNAQRPPSVQYLLSSFKNEAELKVEKAVKALRERHAFLKEPTIEEIAIEVCVIPETINGYIL